MADLIKRPKFLTTYKEKETDEMRNKMNDELEIPLFHFHVHLLYFLVVKIKKHCSHFLK